MKAIETLVINLEAAAKAANYRNLQKYLKQARDEFNIRIECGLNVKTTTLVKEALRISNDIELGTVVEQELREKAGVKVKNVTHTIDEVEAPVKESQPKQASSDIRLMEANNTIEDLRKQLADATNTIAELTEAHKFACETISRQQATINEMAKAAAVFSPLRAVQTVSEPTEPLQAKGEDTLANVINDGLLPDVLTNVYILVKKAYGTYKANELNREIDTIAFFSEHQMATDIRETFVECKVDLNVLDKAIATIPTIDMHKLAAKYNATVEQAYNGYIIKDSLGLTMVNKLRTETEVINWINSFLDNQQTTS